MVEALIIAVIAAVVGVVVTQIFDLAKKIKDNPLEDQLNPSNIPKEPEPGNTFIKPMVNINILSPQTSDPLSDYLNLEYPSINDSKTINDFIYSGNDEKTIKSYIGPGVIVSIIPTIEGKHVTVIGENAFTSKNLYKITIGKFVTRIEAKAFYNNKLTSVNIPNTVTYIGNEAFAANPLTRVTFEESGISIEVNTFDGNLAIVYKSGGAGTYIRPDASDTWFKGIYN
jgi:hypothetical protein